MNKQIIKGPATVAMEKIAEYDTARLGAILKRERNSRGYSLRRFAEISGVSFGHLSHIERGDFGVSLATFIRICRGLNIQVIALLDAVLPEATPQTTKGAA